MTQVPSLRFLSTVSVFVLKKEEEEETRVVGDYSSPSLNRITSPSSPNVVPHGGNSLLWTHEIGTNSTDGRNGNKKTGAMNVTTHRKNANTFKEYAMMRGQNRDNFNSKKYNPPKTDLIFTYPKDLTTDKTVTINSMPLFCFYSHHHERSMSEYVSNNSKIRLGSMGTSCNNNVQLFPFVMTDYFKNECYCFCVLFDNTTHNEKVAIVFETPIPIYEMMNDIILEMYSFGLFQVFLDAHFRDHEMRNIGDSSNLFMNSFNNDNNYQHLLEKKNLLLNRLEMMIHHIPIPPPSKNIYTSFTLLQKNYVLKYPDVEELPFCNIPISETIFKTLSNDMIVDLVNLILLEKKIILVSESISLLTYCCESLRTLLYPFQFPLMFAFIPHLPVQLLETILSPVPYIAGVHSSLKHELFMVIDQQNRMLEQSSHTTSRIKSPSSASERALSPSENDTSLVVLDIDASTFIYGKAPEREQRFPERYRLQLIEKLEPVLRSASKSLDFLSGPISKREERISTDIRIRELFTWFYCKMLIPLNIHILTRKWKKNNNNKRNGTEYIDNIKRYVLEEAEEIDSNQRAFFSHLFSNQIFSELLNHGIEEQYFYQEMCFSIFVNSEVENLMKNRNHVIPLEIDTTVKTEHLDEFVLRESFDTAFNMNSVQEWFSKGQPNDVLLYWINNKLEAIKKKAQSSTQHLLSTNYNLSRLMLMRSFVNERATRFEQALEDALTAMSTATDERLVRREWFESLLLRIPKQSLMKFVAKMKTKYNPNTEDLFKLGFLEKIVLDMHQGHVQDVKALFQQAELIEPGSSFELRPRRKSVPNSSLSPVDSAESEPHTAESLDDKQLVIFDNNTDNHSQDMPRANSFPSGNPTQLPSTDDEVESHFDSPPTLSPRSPTQEEEIDDTESLEALQTPLTSKKRSFSSTSIHEYNNNTSSSAPQTSVPPTTKATKSSSGTILLSLPFINFSSIEHQLIPKNIDTLSQLSAMNSTSRRKSTLFTKKKNSELDALSRMVNISKEMFSMVAFECGMFFSKQDGDRIYDQLVLIQKDSLHVVDDTSSTLKPETLKKFLNWFKIVNQFNQYSTLRFRKIESPQTVAVSSYEQQQHNNESIVILTQSTLCEATFSYSTLLEGKEHSQELPTHTNMIHQNGRICFCNDGSIYFGISKLELVVSDMSQIIKIDHYPPQSILKQQPDLLNLKIEGSVRIVVRVDSNTTRHVEFKFPNTIQSLVWYGHFLSLMNFSTSITMSMIMSKKSHTNYVPTNPTTVSIFRNITIDHVLYLMKQGSTN